MTTPSSADRAELPTQPPATVGALSLGGLAALLHQDQQRRWLRGERPPVEDYLQRHPQLHANRDLVIALVWQELLLRQQAGEQPNLDEFVARFPDLGDDLRGVVSLERFLLEGPTSEDAAPLASEQATISPEAMASNQTTGACPDSVEVPPTRLPSGPAASGGEGVSSVAVPGYQVLGVLGKGGMGVVYKAQHTALQRTVALKMILHGDYAGEEERRRFRAEARAVAQLQHANIVQIYEVGEHNGLPYFSLEFCSGGSLEKQLDGTPWEAKRAAALVQTLAQAMQAAHQAGLVHRDLKPGNVLLTAEGAPKVTDFGLVKRLDVQGQTQTGAVVGTPSYMAPEQAGGKHKTVGPAADVYAPGAILYELLTGRPPFKAATAMDTVLQVLSEEPVAVRRLQPKVPRDIETICHNCLEKDPGKRYASAAALAEDLRRFLGGEPVQVRPVGPVGRLAKWARRRPAVAALLAVVAVVTVVGGTGILWALGEAVRQRNVADGEADKAQKAATFAEEKAAEARQAALRAEAKTTEAKDEAEKAKKARDRAELQTYYAEIGRADARLSAGEVGGARDVLEGISLEQRGWEHRYLQRRTEGTPLTLRGHTGAVTSVVYSPDGSRIASASQDSTVKVWDVNSGTEVLTLRGHTHRVTSVVYSPDGSRIASASGDLLGPAGTPGELKVWDARSSTEALTLRGHTAKVFGVVYSPDGSRITSLSVDSTVKVWDARSGRLVEGEKAGRWFPGGNLSPDGQHIALPDGNSVRVFPRQPRLGADDPWAEDLQRRTARTPLCHAEELAAAHKRGDTFAAAFHRRRLAGGNNLRLLAWAKLAAGDLQTCQKVLRQLATDQRGFAAAARPWQVSAAGTVGLGARPTLAMGAVPAATTALLHQEELRRAAVLVHAAALLPDSGVDAATLVHLATRCVEADPQSWHSRELLGAALFRGGKPADAVAALEEAVRLHGKGGSLWARLFVALAQRRLGHDQEAKEWRDKTLQADTWEEAVLQRQLLFELDTTKPPSKP